MKGMKGGLLDDDYTSIMAFCYKFFLQGVTISNVAWSSLNVLPLQFVSSQSSEMVSLVCGWKEIEFNSHLSLIDTLLLNGGIFCHFDVINIEDLNLILCGCPCEYCCFHGCYYGDIPHIMNIIDVLPSSLIDSNVSLK